MLNQGGAWYGTEQMPSCEVLKELREQLREAALLGARTRRVTATEHTACATHSAQHFTWINSAPRSLNMRETLTIRCAHSGLRPRGIVSE